MTEQSTANCLNIVWHSAPIITLCLGAVISLVISTIAHNKSIILKAAGSVAPIFLIITLCLSWYLWLKNGNVSTTFLSFDRTALAATGIISIAALFTSLLSLAYLPTDHHVHSEYYALILFSAAGMSVLASATHLITIIIGLETAALSLYALTGLMRYQARRNEAAIKYVLAGMVALALIVMGSTFVFGMSGSASLVEMSKAIPNILATDERWMLLAGAALMLSGICMKIGAVPFHAWFVDVVDGAPTPIAAYIGAAMLAATMTALMRLDAAIFTHLGMTWIVVASVIALITITVGALAATIQENVKRLLAYSTIIHAGFMFMAFPALRDAGQTAQAALIAYLFAYAMMSIGAFAVVIALNEGHEEHHSVSSFAGLGRRRPYLAAALTVFLLALAGLPPTLGFVARYYIFTSSLEAGLWWLALIGAVAGVIAAYAYLRVIVIMYMHRKSASKALKASPVGLEGSTAVLAVIFLCVLAVIFFGLIPTSLIDIVLHSV